VEDVPSLLVADFFEHGDAGPSGDLNMFGSDGRQNIIINNSKIYGNATGTPTWGESFGEHLLKSAKHRLNGHFRNLNWRHLPYIRPI